MQVYPGWFLLSRLLLTVGGSGYHQVNSETGLSQHERFRMGPVSSGGYRQHTEELSQAIMSRVPMFKSLTTPVTLQPLPFQAQMDKLGKPYFAL